MFRLHHGDGDLALKLDLDGAVTGRLVREFDTLTNLRPAFERASDTALIDAVWRDPEALGLISKFVPGPTALRAAIDDPSPENLALLGRHGALFLNVLHTSEPSEEIGYGPGWVTKRLTTLACKTGARAPRIGAAACNDLIQAFREISAAQQGTICLKTRAHGDFHAGNLIVSNGIGTGLDVTEVRRKLGLYDVVDYLSSVDIQRAELDTELTDLGLHQALDDAFTDAYSCSLPRGVLRCAMLGKWLILLFKITEARFTASRFQRVKLKRLQARIAHMT